MLLNGWLEMEGLYNIRPSENKGWIIFYPLPKCPSCSGEGGNGGDNVCNLCESEGQVTKEKMEEDQPYRMFKPLPRKNEGSS